MLPPLFPLLPFSESFFFCMIAYSSLMMLEVDIPWKLIKGFQSFSFILSDGQVRGFSVWYAMSVMLVDLERWKQNCFKDYHFTPNIIRCVLNPIIQIMEPSHKKKLVWGAGDMNIMSWKNLSVGRVRRTYIMSVLAKGRGDREKSLQVHKALGRWLDSFGV